MSEHTPEPDIWLQEYEAEGVADCGCRLVSGVESEDGGPGEDGAAFYFCPLHAAAPALLAALERLADRFAFDGVPEDGEEQFEAAWAAIAAARGIGQNMDVTA